MGIRGVAETDFLGSNSTEVWAYSNPAVPGLVWHYRAGVLMKLRG
ncbi:hypothetical protein ACP5PY_23170 [Photobacterium leiognathi subsp. mandapamensis]